MREVSSGKPGWAAWGSALHFDFANGRYCGGSLSSMFSPLGLTVTPGHGLYVPNGTNIAGTALFNALFSGNYTVMASLEGGISSSASGVLSFGTSAPIYNGVKGWAIAIKNGGANNLNSTNGYTQSFARRIVLSQTSSQRTIVMNGGAEATDAFPISAPSSSLIGSYSGGSYLGGYLKELIIWKYQLHPSLRLDFSRQNIDFKPYASNSAIIGNYGQSVSAGSILTYEYTQPWTVIAGIKSVGLPSSASAGNVIFSTVVNSPYPGYELFLDTSGFPHVRIINNISTHYIGVAGTTNVCDGSQHVIAASYDGSGLASGIKIYIDGVANATTIESDTLGGNSIVGGSHNFTVGGQQNFPAYYFQGALYYFALSNVVRDATYLGGLSSVTAPPAVDGNTALQYVFNEGAGSSTADSSGNGYMGTVSSPVIWPLN